jgi:hypothetical protein
VGLDETRQKWPDTRNCPGGAGLVLDSGGAGLVSLTVVLWLIAATIVPSFLGWFLTVIFMVLFRLAIAPEIACFIGFSAILGSF